MNAIKVNNWAVFLEGDKVEFKELKNNIMRFVARYYVSSIIEHGANALQLDSGIPEWTINKEEMTAIVGWLRASWKA